MRDTLKTYQFLVIFLILVVLVIIPYSLFVHDVEKNTTMEFGSLVSQASKLRALARSNNSEGKTIHMKQSFHQSIATLDPTLSLSEPSGNSPIQTSTRSATALPFLSSPTPPSKPAETNSSLIISIDPDFDWWRSRLEQKLKCKETRGVMYYHYHTRKAAGTSIRDSIRLSARLSGISYMETEGVAMNPAILKEIGVISVTSLRDPIERILSLYWYEHVGWYYSILKKPERCRPLKDWVAAWRDGAELKGQIMHASPVNNYVEIQNYYTKMLIGWSGQGKLTETDLNKAKEVLRSFDMVLITEWLGDETQLDAFNNVFKGRRQISLGHKVTGDKKMKDTMATKLAADEAEIRILLKEMNAFDIELFKYAQSLVALRLKEILRMTKTQPPPRSHFIQPVDRSQCIPDYLHIITKYTKMFGVFQPKGHKGP